ncbi:MAG: amidase [Myxococcota bacterium]
MNDYPEVDATELAARVHRRDVSPLELTELAIRAIEQVNPKLNAVVYRMYDVAAAAAREGLPKGPFHGVPMVLKDYNGTLAGVPYTASSRFLEGFVPERDAEIMRRFRSSGVSFVARTNLPEFALLAATEPQWRGATRNPWSLEHTPGGSSGGSAALVAARAVPVGHGGDGGGSLRIPASHCGLVGLKPTRGRVPLGPNQGEGWGGYVQWGVLTRTVRDTAGFLDVLAGPMAGDPYAAPPVPRPFRDEVTRDPGQLRIAYTTRSLFGKTTDPACAAAVEKTVQALADEGHEVEEAHPSFDASSMARSYVTQIAVGTAANIEGWAKQLGRTPTPAHFEPGTWLLYQIGRAMSGLELQQARDHAMVAGRSFAAFHQVYDVLVTPTVAYPPMRVGELAMGFGQRVGLRVLRSAPVPQVLRRTLYRIADENLERTPNTQLFNQTGQPAISIPADPTEAGIPIGVQLVGRFGDEATLLKLAAQLEQLRPWRDRKPAVRAQFDAAK